MTNNTVDPSLHAVCGLYCGACFHYRAGRPDGRHLLADDARGGRPLAGYTCGGCRSDLLYIHPGCAACEIRDCADDRGVAHCGRCTEFPCDRLAAFRDDGRHHHRDVVENLREANDLDVETWLALQRRRWRCPSCARPFSWYEARCHACGARLHSYGDGVPAKR